MGAQHSLYDLSSRPVAEYFGPKSGLLLFLLHFFPRKLHFPPEVGEMGLGKHLHLKDLCLISSSWPLKPLLGPHPHPAFGQIYAHYLQGVVSGELSRMVDRTEEIHNEGWVYVPPMLVSRTRSSSSAGSGSGTSPVHPLLCTYLLELPVLP